MFNAKRIKYNLIQIYALTEKNIILKLRFKYTLLISFITPVFSILMPLIIFQRLFDFNLQFGMWDETNFLVYQFIAYNVYLLQGVIRGISTELRAEKYWKTLPALIIGPFTRINLLLSVFLTHIIVIFVPFTIFFVLNIIYYPIAISTILFCLLIYAIITLIFSSIGLIIGSFTISNENLWKVFGFFITFIFWASCITYPFELFPEIIQEFINFNPLYHIFDILRLVWVEDNILNTIISNGLKFVIFLISAIFFPVSGVLTFNYVYRKYGIVGY